MPNVEDQIRWSLDYILTNYDENNLKSKRLELRDKLYEFITDNGVPDENGNLIFEFEQPMTVDGDEWYTGLMLQRRVSEFVDDDIARQVVVKYGLGPRCIKTVTIEEIDYDELYACNQEGLVPDEDIDSILSTEESWALVRMKK